VDRPLRAVAAQRNDEDASDQDRDSPFVMISTAMSRVE
jgi:hypothetical protein